MREPGGDRRVLLSTLRAARTQLTGTIAMLDDVLASAEREDAAAAVAAMQATKDRARR